MSSASPATLIRATYVGRSLAHVPLWALGIRPFWRLLHTVCQPFLLKNPPYEPNPIYAWKAHIVCFLTNFCLISGTSYNKSPLVDPGNTNLSLHSSHAYFVKVHWKKKMRIVSDSSSHKTQASSWITPKICNLARVSNFSSKPLSRQYCHLVTAPWEPDNLVESAIG